MAEGEKCVIFLDEEIAMERTKGVFAGWGGKVFGGKSAFALFFK